MYRATSILTALFFVASFSADKTSFASEATPTVATETRILSSIETSQRRNLLRQLAVALAAGGEALSRFRGSTIKNEPGQDSFNPPMLGMDCSLDDIANYVSCYGSAIGNKEEADRRFIRLIEELQAVLPSDRWRGVERSRESIRSEVTPMRIKILALTLYRLNRPTGHVRRLFLPYNNFRVGRDGTTTLMTMVALDPRS